MARFYPHDSVKLGNGLNRILWILTNVAALMFGLGIALPYVFASLFDGYNWSPVIWNVLQLGGLGGLVVFGLMYRMSKPQSDTKGDNT